MRDIAAMGWPVGRLLGNESELLQRYGIGRAILREAIRQLEQRGVARMQRGRAGGLVVALPVEQAAVRAIAGYLEATDADLGAILEAQFLLEQQAATLAAERIDLDQAMHLRALAAALPEATGDADIDAPPHTELRAAIAEAAGNRVLALLIRALNLSSIEIRSMLIGPAVSGDYRERVERSIADKRALVEAIVGAAPDRARGIAESDMRAQAALFERLARSDLQRREVRSLLRGAESEPKLGQALMLRMAEDVARLGAPAGTRIGSETELLERYGVSRSVFREALRLLEQYGVVRMRRGVGGGLFVGVPDMAGVITVMTDHVREMRIGPAELREVRMALQIGLVDLVVMRAPPKALPGLATEGEGDDFSRTLAALAGNVVLELLARILIAADPLPTSGRTRMLAGEVGRALAARDVALARRAMKMLLAI